VPDVELRARRHAALGDPIRLALMDELLRSDRSPSELGARFDLPSNLLAHHLAVLLEAGLVRRTASSGDRRRRYVQAEHAVAAELGLTAPEQPAGPMLFVCTHNSARSQLAAALWREATGGDALSAGTHPADRVRPGAVAAARRAGLGLEGAVPRPLRDVDAAGRRVVTVCDRAHEELDTGAAWWHWSIPDPAEADTPEAYDRSLELITDRISIMTGGRRWN